MSHLTPIYAIWDGNAEVLAADIGESGVLVRQWRNRGNIPPRYWPRIIQAAKDRGSTIPWTAFIAEHAAPAICALCDKRPEDPRVQSCTAVDCPCRAREAA